MSAHAAGSRRFRCGVAACALLVAPALRLSAPGALRAQHTADGSSVLALEVEDAVQAPGDPFPSPIVFILRPGGADLPWSGAEDKDAFAGIRRWQIQIYDFDDRKVHFIQGVGRPPSRRIAWDGADGEGRLLRAGFYTVRLVWLDASGSARRSKPVKVGLLTPPGLDAFTGTAAQVAYTRDGMVIRLAEAVVFDAEQWALRPRSFGVLEKIAAFLRDYPRNRLSVRGHADAIGSADYNRTLSLKRALSLHNFLVEHGVDAARLSYEGRGADEPIASNSTPKGRERNRRVEIVLLKAAI